jgi:hypothetical protein
MSRDSSPAFNPPINRLIGDDPQIIKVPMDKQDFGARSVTLNKTEGMRIPGMAIQHVPNGGKGR